MKLLSHVICARNDNYLGNFKQRLEMAVNYTCNNIEKTGNLEFYELLICDWNSETPLRYDLNLNEAARKCVSFLEVPPVIVKKYGLDVRSMIIGPAVNVAIRRAEGIFIMHTPADVLFPCQSVKSLFELLRGEIPFPADIYNCYLGVERYLIPWQAANRLRYEDLNRYFLLHTTQMSLGARCHGIAAGEGATIVSKDIAYKLRGFVESYLDWGAHDVEFGRRIARFAPLLKATLAGVYCYDLQQSPKIRKTLVVNKDVVVISTDVNDEHWGLGLENIPRKPVINDFDIVHKMPAGMSFDIPISNLSPAHQKENFSLSGFLLHQICCIWILEGIAGLFFHIASRKLFSRNRGMRLVRFFLLSFAFFILLRFWPYNSIGPKQKKWYFSSWYGSRKQLLKTFKRAFIISRRLQTSFTGDTIYSAYGFMAVLATLSVQKPIRFFFACARDLYIAQSAAFIDPTIEITAYDHWINSEISPAGISGFMEHMNFRGYFHFETGPLETALSRLKDTPFAGDPYQCVFLNLSFFRPILPVLFSDLAPLLTPACVIICSGKDTELDYFEPILIKNNFLCIACLPGVIVYQKAE
jgi:hypothetical protein